jgi:radical SAM superfamily enzyme YgiQ (UPF0313 family)
MSNLGFQSIYKLINSYRDCVCERVFWEGDSSALQAVESARPLTDFACLAFSFSYELDYLNLASILKAAAIPLFSKERDDSHPLLIAGGPCITANPAPTAPFFDALCIGEAEVLLPSLLPVLSADINGDQKLQQLAQLPGIYVPSCYDGHTISRQWVKNLDDFPAHSVVLTPDTELGELFLIEVERGCNWNCRFCLVSRIFCPTRFRSLENLLGQAREGLKYRQRIGLVGPVVSDHPQIEALLCGLLDMGAGFSLSSLRLKPLPASLLELIVRGGAQSLAIAPEAGSERLRRAINKGFNEADILAAVKRAAQQSLRQLKLYFMVGLPGETEEDIEAIIHLATKCQEIARASAMRLSLNIAPFVPKAGTAFQRSGMADVTTLEKCIARLHDGLDSQGVEVKSESPQWSHVQGALSRGDTKVAEVLASIEKPSLAGWRRAVKKSGLDIEHYVKENWEEDATLPWSMVS